MLPVLDRGCDGTSCVSPCLEFSTLSLNYICLNYELSELFLAISAFLSGCFISHSIRKNTRTFAILECDDILSGNREGLNWACLNSRVFMRQLWDSCGQSKKG